MGLVPPAGALSDEGRGRLPDRGNENSLTRTRHQLSGSGSRNISEEIRRQTVRTSEASRSRVERQEPRRWELLHPRSNPDQRLESVGVAPPFVARSTGVEHQRKRVPQGQKDVKEKTT
jgi:hypothetical protein